MGGEAPAAGGPPPSAPHPLTLRVLFTPFPVLFFSCAHANATI